MDPYSPDGELALIHNAFHQGQFDKVTEWDTSSFSSEYQLPAKMLQVRARLALGRYDEVLSIAKGQPSPDMKAAAVAAEYFKKQSESSPAVEKAKKLAESDGDNANVEILCGTILARIGETEQALALLSKHQGSLDVYEAT
jgi:coatomer protein complex subunit epsilon